MEKVFTKFQDKIMDTTNINKISNKIPAGRSLARGGLFLTILLLVVVIGAILLLVDGLYAVLMSMSWIQGGIVLLLAGYDRLIRPWHMRWGATKEEVNESIPGDELSKAKYFRSTRAITVKASAEEVWPWLVQMGWKKGAFYSYNWLEKLFGMQMNNADEIHPEWQELEEGDEIWVAPPKYGESAKMKVDTLVPNRTLALATSVNGGWSLHLDPVDEQSCRLIARFHMNPPGIWGKIFHYAVLEPVHFIMERGMLKGIKKRAEKK